MRILAIETTDRAGSVAVFEDETLLAELDLDPAIRSAESLAPGIVSILGSAGWQSSDVELVAVASGPGSFTGLRVGVTTAKLFAYASESQVLGINSLEAIAWQTPSESGELWTVMDAQREQVFVGKFFRDATGVPQWHGDAMLLDNSVWLENLSAGQTISGPGLAKLIAQLPVGVRVIEQSVLWPKAAAVGQLASRQYQSGGRSDVFTLLPRYYRRSAAEEKQSLST